MTDGRPPEQGTAREGQGWLARIRWGGNALIALYISILSGVVVGLQYDVANPFHSTVAIELLVPYGAFWRGLHFYSSQAFFLLLLMHMAVIIAEGNHGYRPAAWARLSATVPLAILLLFTGYVLRGDITGASAGRIAEQIALSLPVGGQWCNDLLFAITDNGLKRVYVQHLAGLVLFGAWCAWEHLRRYRASWRNHLPLLCLLLAISLLMAAPLDAERLGQVHVAGPWFFLGLQELLRYLPPFWAGIALPGVFVLALMLVPAERQRQRPWLLFVGLWLLLYTVATLVALQRG
ncbi:MAG: hypothetical protein BWK76_08525 [Desulfobulbaceae bacterium A2]|nr:MAG: hypothetical protein BWK76_08525 [Desulfobulbaceae bacterium A2]